MTKRRADALNGVAVDAVVSANGVVQSRTDDEIQITMLGSGVQPAGSS
jgi:hypothetical protein